jgi:hypothetical protein
MSAITEGTAIPQVSTGNSYAINAHRFASPKIIVYVTHNYYLEYLMLSGIFFGWLLSIVCVATAAQILGLGRQVK